MKTIKTLLLLLIIGFAAHAQKFNLNITKSKLQWKVSTMGQHFGYILFKSGNLVYNAGKPATGQFVIDMNKMVSEDGKEEKDRARVDGELRKPDFFDVDKYPVATMQVARITPTKDPNVFTVTGNMTIKSTTARVTFPATIKKANGVVTATAKFTIDRKIWYIHHKPDADSFIGLVKDKMMADEVEIKLNLVFG